VTDEGRRKLARRLRADAALQFGASADELYAQADEVEKLMAQILEHRRRLYYCDAKISRIAERYARGGRATEPTP
jgi:hypothetical protein